jgi:hypothetical protein
MSSVLPFFLIFKGVLPGVLELLPNHDGQGILVVLSWGLSRHIVYIAAGLQAHHLLRAGPPAADDTLNAGGHIL